jgi:uncharacterized protein (DUF2235 family)
MSAGNAGGAERPQRRLLVCLDGTGNEPETGATNVARLFAIAGKSPEQLVYYDPGVGTMGARSATTRAGKALTRVGGLVLGHGIKDNLEEAYRWLMNVYQPGDRIFVVGFSRGAYTALALTGMLRHVGLLRPGADNLVPYAVKMYAKRSPENPTDEQQQRFFAVPQNFDETFGNPHFNRYARNVTFLGLWDTVKFVGWLNWKARLEQARWPYTRKVYNVAQARLALAIDENRRPYAEYRFDPGQVAKDPNRLQEVWFAGVHSDVGGQFPDDHRLSDIALKWMADEAAAAGLVLDPDKYQKLIGAAPGQPLSPDTLLGKVHNNKFGWALIGLGWRRRRILPGDIVHPSVYEKVAATADTSHPYKPKLPT